MFAATTSRFLKACACAMVAGAVLAGCSGSDGSVGAPGAAGATGPAGPAGPSGPAGPVTALDVATARLITGRITAVSGTTQPTVSFLLVNDIGQPLKGLPASAIRFTVNKLVPGTNGASSQWVSYINTSAAPTAATNPVASWGTVAKRQATAEGATTAGGVYTDNGDGTYTYRFAKELGAYTAADNPGAGPAVAYDGAKTHRIGFEIRGTGLRATNNPVYTYVPATGSTSTLPDQRDIVNTAECSACHDKLAFHGGPRTDVQYCVACHNPGTVDPQSGNSLDMKVMVHKIHMGVKLPSVVAGGTQPAAGKGYTIWGNSLSYWNFNEIVFTQDVRNCTTCHRESDPSTPQAGNYKSVINAESCGTCHDNVNFATGVNHAGIGTTDADCATCHGPASNLNGGALRVVEAHRIPAAEAAKKFAYQVVSVTGTAPGEKPVVTIKVTDPTNGNAPYDIQQAGGPFQIGNASVRVDLAWSTTDFANLGSGSGPAQPVSVDFKTGATKNADGTFTKASSVAVPLANVAGSGAAYLEGRPNAVLPGDTAPTALAVTSNGLTFKITGTSPVARRQVVDIKKCNDCHNVLSLHGSNRTGNTELCSACHNPGATDIGRRPAGGAPGVDGLREQSIDLKWMIHAIHSGDGRSANGKPTVIYGYGGSVNDFGHVVYPGDLANCEGCHKADTYYPVDTAKVLGTSFDTGASRTDPSDDKVTSPNSAACGACHTAPVAVAHMQQNGGAPGVLVGGSTAPFWGKSVSASGVANAPSGVETCTLCHGPGASADVKRLHGVGDFKFN